jgi:hypothetical protein
MRAGFKLAVSLIAGVVCIPAVGLADTPAAPHPADTPATHRAHKAKKVALPPPLPSGTQGPVPQIPLDSMPAVPPQINYQDGQLTIVAPNSTLADILRGVRKHTSADIDIPSNATERVATSLGPGPARDVVAQLLNGSHFNYVLLGSPENAGLLVRVVLVAKTPDTPAANAQAAKAPATAPAPAADAADAEAADEAVEETPDQAAEAEQQQTTPDQPGVKTPQQMLQEMQQRQLQMQQNGQPGAAAQPGQPGQPGYPPPGMPLGQRPQPPPQQQDQQQQ